MKNYRPAKKLSVIGAATLGVLFTFNASASTLREIVAETLSSNPQVKAQEEETQARNRQVREALGGFYPDVDLTAGYGFEERDPVSQLIPGSKRNALTRGESQLSVRQMVFDGFDTWNQYQNQKSREESARVRTKAVGEQIALDAIKAYLDVLKRKAILDLAKQTLDFHQDIYQRMKKRYDSGVGSKADLDQISGRLAFARTNLFNARANLIDAQTNFQQVVGRYPRKGELEKPNSYRQLLPATVDDAVAKAKQNHPIVKVADADLQAVKYQYEQTKSAYYPKFYVDVERALNHNIDGVEGQIDDLQVMLRMRYNLYNGRSDQARKQQYANLVEKAREIRDNAVRQVEQETRLAWSARRSVKEQLPALEAYVKNSQATREAYMDQFDLGRRTLLDLLNTQNENISARESLVEAQYDLVYDEYRLFQDMGELLYVMDARL